MKRNLSFFKLSIFVILIFILALTNCKSDSLKIKFSILDEFNQLHVMSTNVNAEEIDMFFKDSMYVNFNKLLLTQYNGDNLIIEQKDNEGYLVIIKIKYEQFLIKDKPNQLDSIKNIMKNYLLSRDQIMNRVKFY